jgi:histidinol phosphatase-like enzyme (inositol monophosphatase family)
MAPDPPPADVSVPPPADVSVPPPADVSVPPPADPALLEEAVDLTRQAGELTLRWFRSIELSVDHKGDGTPVTAADKAAERFLREELEGRFPDDAIHGEEEADKPGTSGRRWIIDPIDGTKAFTKGVPLYCNLLALEDEHGVALGVINLPGLTEVVYAGRGLGAFCNAMPARVSECEHIDEAYLTTSGFGGWSPAAIAAVIDVGIKLRTWGDGFGYALVATGRVEAMVDQRANPWDVAPATVILAEAGGRFTSMHGDDGFQHGSGLGTNGILHDELLDLFDGTFEE